MIRPRARHFKQAGERDDYGEPPSPRAPPHDEVRHAKVHPGRVATRVGADGSQQQHRLQIELQQQQWAETVTEDEMNVDQSDRRHETSRRQAEELDPH